MNMQFFFLQKRDKVCAIVSPIPPNLNVTLSLMCKYMERANLGCGELSGLAWLIAYPQT
jgi:hypothetical protein